MKLLGDEALSGAISSQLCCLHQGGVGGAPQPFLNPLSLAASTPHSALITLEARGGEFCWAGHPKAPTLTLSPTGSTLHGRREAWAP